MPTDCPGDARLIPASPAGRARPIADLPNETASPLPGRGLVGSVSIVAGLTLVSRILGLVREGVFGYYLGTSEYLSAFRIAFQVPNLARRLFGEGALSSAMVPVLTQTLRSSGEEASRRFVGAILTLLLAVLGAGLLGAEVIIAVWRWVHDDLTLELTAITLPYAALICMVAVIGGALNVRGHFAAPAAAPILLNVANIVAVLVGATYLGLAERPLIYLVCISVLAAGVLQLAFTAWALRWVSFVPRLNLAWRDPNVRRVIALMAPTALGLSAVQISALADNIIAYLYIIEDGKRIGPAVLGYAQILYQLPLGVFGISIATAIFPLLSARAAAGDRAGLAESFERGVRLSLFIALPASIGLILIARPLVAAILQRGEFDADDALRVAATLVFYSFGLSAYFAQHIVVRTFFAMQDSKTPARTAGVMVVVNLAMNLALVQVMQEQGLALSTAICATLQVAWLAMILHRRLPVIRWSNIASGGLRMLAASGIMGGVLATIGRFTPLGSADIGAATRTIVAVAAGGLIYALCARLFQLDEFVQIVGRLRRR